MHHLIHVVGNVIVDIIRMEVLVQNVKHHIIVHDDQDMHVIHENIVVHEQVVVVVVQISQQTHIIHLMHHLMHVVGLVMHDIIKTEVLVLLVELENGVAHDQLVVVI